MSEPIVVVDTSEISRGKLEELKAAVDELVRFVESNEPRPIAYNVYLSHDETRVTVVQVHPDSASMEFHMQVAAPAFRRFADLLALRATDVYGAPNEHLLEQLRQKVGMLGSAAVVVHDRHAGFARFGVPTKVEG